MAPLRYDAHTYTAFSGGSGSGRDNVRAAQAAGLTCVALTDRVAKQTSSDEVSDWLAAAERLDKSADIKVLGGVEGEILDIGGAITVNRRTARRASLVLATLSGETEGIAVNPPASPKRYAGNVIDAYLGAAADPVVNVIANPFNLGRFDAVLTPGQFSSARLRRLATTMYDNNVALEISNQAHSWYPQMSLDEFTREFVRLLRIFSEQRAKFVVGSSAASPDGVGNLRYCSRLMKEADIQLSQLVDPVRMAQVRKEMRDGDG